MELHVTIFVRRHPNQTYTVTVPRLPDISAFGPTFEECKSEVTLALIQRLEDMDPAFASNVAAAPGTELTLVDVELHPKRADGRRRRNSFQLHVSLLLTPVDDQIMVQAVRLKVPPYDYPLTFYIRHADELNEVARAEIAEYFSDAPLEALQSFQGSRYERIETIPVTFKAKSPVLSMQEQQANEERDFWALRASGVNLTAQAKEKQLGRAYRREQTVAEVLQILSGENKTSLILVGDSGVGKTAIVHEIARLIQRKECPEVLWDRELWSVTGASLMAGMSFIGQWQEKLTNLVHEVRKKRHLLFVEDVAGLADAGRWSKSDENMASFLKPYIQTGDVVVIGESTPQRLRYTDRLTPGFLSQFRTVPVAQPSVSDTLGILATVVHRLESAENVRIQPAALEAAVELTGRYQPYRALPGKAISLVEQTVGDSVSQRQGNDREKRLTIDRRHVVASFARQSGLPEFIISDTAPLEIDTVRQYLAERVIGQQAAVDALTDLVAVIKAGLNDPNKPLGTFLFIGPTGVGKTEMAKTLASYLFGDEKRLLRFDMSEYMDPAAVRRLIGMPGSDNEGELTSRVRSQPFSVLLLDEFEKADPLIYDLFLQVMGEGRLTDATGQTTSFQNTVILLTSNLGSGAREQRSLGLAIGNQAGGAADAPGYWRSKIEQYFRPEFVNRIDQVVVFKSLGTEAMHQIARRELGHVLMREGLVRRNLLAEVDDGIIDLLVEQGFDPAYGARPLKRAIERLVVTPMARFLAGRPDGGGDLLRLRRTGGQVSISAVRFSADERAAPVVLGGTLQSSDGRKRRLDDKDLVEAFATLRLKLQMWRERPDVIVMEDERSQALAAMNKPTFWDTGWQAQQTMNKFYRQDRFMKRLRQLTERAEYLEELAGLVRRERDSSYRNDLADSYVKLERDVDFLEVELLMFSHEYHNSAWILMKALGQRLAEGSDAELLKRLARMYVRWGMRKGYEISISTLEPLQITKAEAEEAWQQIVRDPLAYADIDNLNCHNLVKALYPYKWSPVAGATADELLKSLSDLNQIRELGITLEGSNVLGFLGSEQGIHRINEQRPSGERVKALIDVQVKHAWGATGHLAAELCWRGYENEQLRKLLPEDEIEERETVEPEVARIYQLVSPRHITDPRTKARHPDVETALDGDLDDFILAYLRLQQGQDKAAT